MAQATCVWHMAEQGGVRKHRADSAGSKKQIEQGEMQNTSIREQKAEKHTSQGAESEVANQAEGNQEGMGLIYLTKRLAPTS